MSAEASGEALIGWRIVDAAGELHEGPTVLFRSGEIKSGCRDENGVPILIPAAFMVCDPGDVRPCMGKTLRAAIAVWAGAKGIDVRTILEPGEQLERSALELGAELRRR